MSSPKDFGAIGDGIADDGPAFQAWLDHIAANDVGIADSSGVYAFTNATAPHWGRNGNPKTKIVHGNCFLKPKTPGGDIAITIEGWTEGYWEFLDIFGTGNTNNHATHTWKCGLKLKGSGRSRFGNLRAQLFSFAGVFCGEGNNSLIDFGAITAHTNGSGGRNGSVNYGIVTTISNVERFGAANSTLQYSTFNVQTLPPQFILDGMFGSVGSVNHCIRLTNLDGSTRLYWIKAIDPVEGKVTVEPWVDANVDTSVPADYVYGAGLWLLGNDANVLSFDRLDASRNGVALACQSLYPPTGKRMVGQFNGCAVMFGRTTSSAALGGKMDGFYFENCIEDIIYLSRAPSAYNAIDSEYALNLAKCYVVGAPRRADNSVMETHAGFRGFRLSHKGRLHQWEKASNQINNFAMTFSINRADMVLPLQGDSAQISFAALDRDLHRLMGYDTARVVVVGSGANGEPTGTITFERPSIGSGGLPDASWTINGGTSAVQFSGFSRPAEFIACFDVKANNFRVVRLT